MLPANEQGATVMAPHSPQRSRVMTTAAEPSVADVLRAARAKIAEPEHWAKGADALNAAGKWADPLSADAVSWCAIGALGVSGRYWMQACDLMESLLPDSCDRDVARFNDDPTTTHADILALFDRAIAAAEKAVAA